MSSQANKQTNKAKKKKGKSPHLPRWGGGGGGGLHKPMHSNTSFFFLKKCCQFSRHGIGISSCTTDLSETLTDTQADTKQNKTKKMGPKGGV